ARRAAHVLPAQGPRARRKRAPRHNERDLREQRWIADEMPHKRGNKRNSADAEKSSHDGGRIDAVVGPRGHGSYHVGLRKGATNIALYFAKLGIMLPYEPVT